MCAIETRGTQSNPRRIPEEIWKMVKDHWASIPHKKSHYCYNKTQKKYFEYSDLNVKILHNLFQDYYKEKTGCNTTLKYNTYHTFFRNCSEYTFRSPKTDVCDFCTKCNVKLAVNPKDSCNSAYIEHTNKVKDYQRFKDKYVARNEKNKNVCTFDRKIYDENLVLEFGICAKLSSTQTQCKFSLL